MATVRLISAATTVTTAVGTPIRMTSVYSLVSTASMVTTLVAAAPPLVLNVLGNRSTGPVVF